MYQEKRSEKKEKRTPSRLAAGDTKETKKSGQGRTKSRQKQRAGRFESILEPGGRAVLRACPWFGFSLGLCVWVFGADEQMDGLRPCVRCPEASEMGSRGIDWSASACLGEGSLRAGNPSW